MDALWLSSRAMECPPSSNLSWGKHPEARDAAQVTLLLPLRRADNKVHVTGSRNNAQELRSAKDTVEARIGDIAEDIASDLGLQMDKSIRLEWYKVANTRTRCLRITQAGSLPPSSTRPAILQQRS